MAKRKHELSFMNIICCLTVIFIHVNSEAINVCRKGGLAFGLSYTLWQVASFVVYGFIFLSGVKQFLSADRAFKPASYYWRRFKSILLPYLLWVCLYYAYDCATQVESFDLANLRHYILTGDYVGHFYFVIIIVQFYVLMPLWLRLFKRVNALFMLPLSLILMNVFGTFLPNILGMVLPDFEFAYADRTFTAYLFYWAAGAYVGMNYDRAKALFCENRRFIYVTFALIAAFSLATAYYSSVGEKYYTWLDNVMQMYRIAAVIALFTFSLGKVNGVCENKAVALFDASSYNIYLCHCLLLKEINRLFGLYGVDGLAARYFVRAAAVFIIPSALCMAYTLIKKSIKNRRLR